MCSGNRNTTTDPGSWKRHEGDRFHTHETSLLPIAALNDVADLNNNSRHEVKNEEYVSVGDRQFTGDDKNNQPPVANCLTSNATVTALKDDPTLTDNPAYVTNTSHPLLADNPAYVALKHAPPSATTSD